MNASAVAKRLMEKLRIEDLSALTDQQVFSKELERELTAALWGADLSDLVANKGPVFDLVYWPDANVASSMRFEQRHEPVEGRLWRDAEGAWFFVAMITERTLGTRRKEVNLIALAMGEFQAADRDESPLSRTPPLGHWPAAPGEEGDRQP